ncbi:MAG TPA: hypothetical protein VFB20_10715 [Burkholderiales bacterium]|nr:hypothetical protein [Burkholderiales bacterium]
MTAPTRYEFDALREEMRQLRADLRALETRLWGVLVAVFLLMAGALVSQFRGVPHAPAAAAEIVRFLLALIGG